MTEKNKKLAELFNKIADFLEFKGELVYKISAYRKVARVLESLSEDIEELYLQGRLSEIPGVGQKIHDKIVEFIKTGTIKKYEELKREFPEELIVILDIPNVGPKTVKAAYEKLNVRNINDFIKVVESGELLKLPGMGPKKLEKIKKGIELFTKGNDRMLLSRAMELAESIKSILSPYCTMIEAAGSLRRMKETVGDIDILAVGERERIINAFVSMDGITEVLAKGETKASIIIKEKQVDLRIVEKDQWGAALQYFTGSKEHNIKLREIAKENGFKINEYGVFDKNGRKLAGKTEEEVYNILGLIYIPPELREDRGEIEAAKEGKLPDLIKLEDVKGDLHIHSNWSDGSASIEDIAKKAADMGYRYIAITDHSKSMKIARGLDENKLLKQIDYIRNINENIKDITILCGIEVDILADGSLDIEDSVLKELDWVIAAIHTRFSEDATYRLIKAMNNRFVNCIAHPSGRIIFSRNPYPVNWEKVLEEAAQTGTALEINAHEDRLDLTDILSKEAKQKGVKIAIGTDSHHPGQMWMMKLGIGVARRGWLTKNDVLNCMDVDDLIKFCKQKRGG